MSRQSSVSVEIVPPARVNQSLAQAMDDSFKANDNKEEEEEERIDELDGHDRSDEPEIEKVEGYTMSAVYPPNPCERCVRTNKTCKGIAGARCEYCKRLKQKCSNSTGPARGKHAVPRKILSASANAARANAAEPSSSTWQVRPKRKASDKPSASQNGGPESDDELGEGDDGHQPPTKMNKKRRSGKSIGTASARAQLLKYITELDASAKRLQSQTAKEVEKIHSVINALSAEVRDMEED